MCKMLVLGTVRDTDIYCEKLVLQHTCRYWYCQILVLVRHQGAPRSKPKTFDRFLAILGLQNGSSAIFFSRVCRQKQNFSECNFCFSAENGSETRDCFFWFCIFSQIHSTRSRQERMQNLVVFFRQKLAIERDCQF